MYLTKLVRQFQLFQVILNVFQDFWWCKISSRRYFLKSWRYILGKERRFQIQLAFTLNVTAIEVEEVAASSVWIGLTKTWLV